jgi:hypothetical protein
VVFLSGEISDGNGVALLIAPRPVDDPAGQQIARCLQWLVPASVTWCIVNPAGFSIESSPNVELGIPIHIFEQNLLPAAVIEFCGPAVDMAGDSLGGFKGAVIFQKVGYPSRPE